MKRVAIVGAGIAGLSAGVYARKAGFDVEVFEAHALPGGLCTAWKRNGFVFDGCIHYLLGTQPASPFYRLWEEVGAVQGRKFVYPNALATAFDRTGRRATLFCDPSRLEEHLCDLSPDDAELTRQLCRLVRALQRVPMRLDKAPELMGVFDIGRLLWALRPVAQEWSFCFNTSISRFAARYRDRLVRQLLEGTMDPRSPLLNLVSILGDLARQNAGYPIGGSLPFARSIETHLRSLGGKVHYNQRVARVTVQSGCATGIDLEDGKHIDADFVIAASDLRATLDNLLDARFPSSKHERLFRKEVLHSAAVQISFGLDRQFSRGMYAVSHHVAMEKPLATPGRLLESIAWISHDQDPTLAPPGRSVITCLLPAEFRAWEELGLDTPAYREAKASLAHSVAESLEEPLPGFSQAIQTVDVATPLTYRRYTGNFQGAYMTWLGSIQRRRIPKEVPGLDRFLMIGMWVAAPGGLPSAVKSARDAIQILCKREGVPFRTGMD